MASAPIRRLRLIAVLAAGTILTACQSVGIGGGGYDLPSPAVAGDGAIPADASAVGSAVVEGLAGRNPSTVMQVRFAPSAGLDNQPFAYDGFSQSAHNLLRHGAREDDAGISVAAGKLTLADTGGRRTAVLYYAEYRFDGADIEITHVEVATLFAVKPEAAMFVMPFDQSLRREIAAASSFGEVLAVVRDNAVSVKFLASTPAGTRDYLVVVFLMDRVSPSSKLVIKMSDRPSGTGGYAIASTYRDFDGWRVGVMPGQFDLAKTELYVKAVFQEGEGVGFFSRSSRVVGLFPLGANAAGEGATMMRKMDLVSRVGGKNRR